MSKLRRGGRGSRTRLFLIVAGALMLLVAMVGYQVFGKVDSLAAGPQVTIVQTAGTTDEVDVVWPSDVGDLLTATADGNGELIWVKTDGDGNTQIVERDLTPVTRSGNEVKPTHARAQRIVEDQAELLAEMNAFDSIGGRDVLSALQSLPAGAGPVIVVSSLLSTQHPLRVMDLAFDAPISEVVEHLKSLGELPKGLNGRQVWLVATPVAGAQQALRATQKAYLTELFEGIIEASGGQVVRILDGQEAPAGEGGSAPTTPVPPPPGTFTIAPELVPPSEVPDGIPVDPTTTLMRCVVPTPVMFEPDDDALLDEPAAKIAVASCLGDDLSSVISVHIVGHTARTGNAPDNPTAVSLSLARARKIAEVATSLNIRPETITAEGVGATKPLVQPSSSAFNRAVEILVVHRV